MVGVSQQVTGYRVSNTNIDVVELRSRGGLDDVTLCVSRCRGGSVCTLERADFLRNRQITVAVKSKNLVCPCGGTHSELRRGDGVGA